MDINSGLSEYWHGGLGSKVGMVDKTIGKSNNDIIRDGSRLFNNDDGMTNMNGGRGGDGGIAKLLLRGDDGIRAAAAAAERMDGDKVVVLLDDAAVDSSEDVVGSESDENHDGALPLLGQKQQLHQGEYAIRDKKFRPSLSYARSSLTSRNVHKAAAAHGRRVILTKKKWTLSNILWVIFSFILMIPILEASVGEMRRRTAALHMPRLNNNAFRFRQRWRTAFRGSGGGTVMTSTTNSGRVRNVHNL